MMLLEFVVKGPFNNISAMIQIMAWRRPGDKPLSEPMSLEPAKGQTIIRTNGG